MDTVWQYASNQFLNATIENYKKAYRLSQYHDGVLAGKQAAADPDDVLMYTRYHPVHEEFVVLYTAWKNAGGQQVGQTLTLNQLLDQSKSKLDVWDPQIQVVHVKTSPEYNAIFPQGRKPYYQGSIDTRIEAFNTLAAALSNVALAATKAEVLAHYGNLNTARDNQSSSKATKTGSSDLLELKRAELMELQFGDVGVLINKYFQTPQLMEQYFELNILRESNQVLFTGTLEPDEVEPVLTHTFLADDQLRAEAGPEAGIKIFLGQQPGQQGTASIGVDAGAVSIITISQFGPIDLATFRYLTVANSTEVATSYEIELL